MDELEGRTLVLCFDGTAKHYGDGNTNVIRLFEGLHKMDPRQVCYYQPGIGRWQAVYLVRSRPDVPNHTGTYVAPTKPLGQLTRGLSKTLDMAVALLVVTIEGKYRVLLTPFLHSFLDDHVGNSEPRARHRGGSPSLHRLWVATTF